ncbi:hypothetical protein DMX11_21410 [Pseudomonas sp. LB-090624]|nr:hypothetical protein DMX11_21410 [Pseudomonas sp. LB-090624]
MPTAPSHGFSACQFFDLHAANKSQLAEQALLTIGVLYEVERQALPHQWTPVLLKHHTKVNTMAFGGTSGRRVDQTKRISVHTGT